MRYCHNYSVSVPQSLKTVYLCRSFEYLMQDTLFTMKDVRASGYAGSYNALEIK